MKINKVIRGLNALGSDVKFVFKREIDFYKVRPKSAMLMLTYECNSKCKTCNIWRRYDGERFEEEIGIDEWKIVIDKLIERGIKAYELFGGNVLLRKDVLISLL